MKLCCKCTLTAGAQVIKVHMRTARWDFAFGLPLPWKLLSPKKTSVCADYPAVGRKYDDCSAANLGCWLCNLGKRTVLSREDIVWGEIDFIMSTNIALIHHSQLLKVQLVPNRLILLTLSIRVILDLAKNNWNLLDGKLNSLSALSEGRMSAVVFLFDIEPIVTWTTSWLSFRFSYIYIYSLMLTWTDFWA